MDCIQSEFRLEVPLLGGAEEPKLDQKRTSLPRYVRPLPKGSPLRVALGQASRDRKARRANDLFVQERELPCQLCHDNVLIGLQFSGQARGFSRGCSGHARAAGEYREL